MKREEPQGKLTHTKTEIKENKHAVYIDVFFEDENGTEWYFHTSSFKFDLQKGVMPLTIDQWHKLDAQLNLIEDDNETLGTHMQLISVLNELGYYPKTKQSAIDLAYNLAENCSIRLSAADKGE